MSSFNTFGIDKGVTIRQPSTANLLVDSSDRDSGATAFDFSIQSLNNLGNGYFTRIATAEVCLEWCFPNVYVDLANRRLNGLARFDISGTSVSHTGTYTVTLPQGNYTIKQILDATVLQLNFLIAQDISGITFSLQQLGNQNLVCNAAVFRQGKAPGNAAVNDSTYWEQLSTSPTYLTYSNIWNINNPDFRPYRYLDFVCEQLTYCQDVKDATTNPLSRDVLCRWYMCEDTQESYDAYGYPIYMGYQAFKRRRIFNPPKFIRWENDTPIGNLRFQVFGMPYLPIQQTSPIPIVYSGALALLVNTEWTMTLQLSEN